MKNKYVICLHICNYMLILLYIEALLLPELLFGKMFCALYRYIFFTIFFEYDSQDKFACSCIDCAGSCPVGEAPQLDPPAFEVAGLHGATFIVAIVVGLMGILAVIISISLWSSRKISFSKYFRRGFIY